MTQARGRHTRISLLLLLWVGMALRTWGLDAQSLWRDEVDTVRFATQPLPQLLSMFTTPGHNGPFYYLLLRPWIQYFGHVDFALRYSALLLGLLAIPLFYQVMRKGTETRVALLAALLLTASPYAIWYSQELRMYTLVLVIALGATWCWQRALWDGRTRYWIPYVLLLSVGIYTHYLLALLIPTHIILSVFWPRQLWRRAWVWILAYGFFVLPYIPLAWWQEKLLFSPTFRTGHPFVPWPQMIQKLLTVFSVGVHTVKMPAPLPPGSRLVPLLFLAFSGLFLLTAEESRQKTWVYRRRLWLLLWFLLPIGGLYLISLELPLFTERYLIWTMPALYGLAALGAVALRHKPGLSLLLVGFVLTLFLLGVGYQVRYPIKPDMRDAVAYVETHRQPDSVVLLHLGYLIHAYTYYAPGTRSHLQEAPAPGPGGNLEQTGRDILVRLNGATDVWLVESESAMWDPKGLVRQWLDTHGRRLEVKNFVGVQVAHYRLQK